MSSVLLEASGLSKVLGSGAAQVRAVKNVSLALRGGELTMLMGPSGSGKTTLLSILGCMLVPTAGEIRICGRAVTGADSERMAMFRRDYIGFVFQSYHLFPTLTATENVQLALDVRGRAGGAARRASRAALATVGLGKKLDSYPLALSGGEQQRVAIARALVSDPAIILADEPTAALDTVNGQSLMQILRDIAADARRSVLVVTHDTRLIPFASRILSIEDGRLVGEKKQVRRRIPTRRNGSGRRGTRG
jgi:putative ABC transport system ATP-binding protein